MNTTSYQIEVQVAQVLKPFYFWLVVDVFEVVVEVEVVRALLVSLLFFLLFSWQYLLLAVAVAVAVVITIIIIIGFRILVRKRMRSKTTGEGRNPA